MQWATGLQLHYIMYYISYGNVIVFKFHWFTQQWEPRSAYCSAMQWATRLQFYYVIANSKVDE